MLSKKGMPRIGGIPYMIGVGSNPAGCFGCYITVMEMTWMAMMRHTMAMG